MLCRVNKRFLLCLVAGILAIPAAAVADPPDAERFYPAPHSGDVLSVYGASPAPHMQLQLGAMLHVSDDSLVLRDGSGDMVGRLVDSRTVLDLTMSLGLGERLDLGIGLPFVINQRSDVPSTIDLSGVRSGGVGDVRLSGKLLLVTHRQLSVSLALPISLPTGDADSFIGGEYAVAPTAVGEYRLANKVRLLANLGVNLRRPRDFAELEAGTELRYGAAAQVPVTLSGEPFNVVATVFGAVDLKRRSAESAPLEVLAALDYTGVDGLVFTVGGGPGLSRGYGTPDFRLFAGLRYRPRIDGPTECATGAEDYDGFEDGDGCADPDNDGDGVPDTADVCPNEPETRNGVRDDDGCPELAQTRAGVGDRAVGRAPLPKPELARDTDGDGLAGEDDACPDQPEDMDGFEDDDGCPDADNDGDGIADAIDKCPLVAETGNGFSDADGCPDAIPPRLARFTGKVMGVRFRTASATLRPSSRMVLDAAARVLVEFPSVRVEVAGHTDDRGSRPKNTALSLARARAVRGYLIRKGVAAGRITAVGLGPDKPIADNKTAAGRAKNRRVEFRLTTAPAGATP